MAIKSDHLTLEIRKISCRNLKKVGMMGDEDDPFVLLHFDKFSIKTPTIDNGGSNVDWNDVNFSHEFHTSTLSEQNISLEVFDENTTFANALIGSGTFPLAAIAGHSLEEEIEYEISIFDSKRKSTGKVKLYMMWIDNAALLAENEELKNESTTLNAKFAQEISSLTTTQKKLETDLAAMIAERDAAAAQLAAFQKSSKEHITSLESQCALLQSSLRETADKLHESEENHATGSDSFNELTQHCNELKQALDNKLAEVTVHVDEKGKLQSELQSHKATLAESHADLEATQVDLAAIRSERNRLKADLDAFKAMGSDWFSSVRAKLTAFDAELASMQ